jgi:hypothetical protein
VPLRGGYVFFDNPQITSKSFFTRTDAKGAYTVSDLPNGDYYVSARRFSEQANQVVGDLWYYPGVLDKQSAALAVVHSNGPTVVDVHFGSVRAAAGVVSVRTDEGTPVARVDVEVHRRRVDLPSAAASTGDPVWTFHDIVRTGADGVARIRKLPAGDYRVYLSKLPSPLASWRNPSAASTSLERYSKAFAVVADQREVAIDFVVTKGLDLSGRFLMRDGSRAPAGHAIAVDLLSSPHVGGFVGNMSFRVAPDALDSGGFVFHGLSAREPYTLREFQGNHLKPFVIVGMRMNGRSLEGDEIVVPAGVLDVILERSAVVGGRVTGFTGQQSATARRLAGAAPPALYRETMTTDIVDGQFVFRGLPPGTYEISVQGVSHTETIEVAPGEVLELLF